MGELATWAITTLLTIFVGALGFFMKRHVQQQDKVNENIRKDFLQGLAEQRADFQKTIKDVNCRVDKVEEKLEQTINALPFQYTLRDDFIRSMAGVENKLDKILNKLSGIQ